MGDVSDTIKKTVGPASLGVAALVLIFAITYLFVKMMVVGDPVVGATLPLIAIGGLIVLILLLTVVAMIFSVLGLTNKDQAMGLPEGSIRAVIALSLIILFTILSVFLYKNIKGDDARDKFQIIERLSDTERNQFILTHPTARDIQSVVSKDKAGNPVKTSDNKDLYDVSYRSTNPASDDFAKQLLVLMGTLMTAVTSFYLGAGTVTSGVTAGQNATRTDAPAPPSKLESIKPASHSVSKDGTTIHLGIIGSNLNGMTHAKIVRENVEVIGTNVHSNETGVTCDIPVSDTTTPPGEPWDVVVDDGGVKRASLRGVLTITA